ncbi:MAG: histidine kinase [Chitinophagaceae bacterium]|nr:histidine kinase [Chitinophagaceae bacterium]
MKLKKGQLAVHIVSCIIFLTLPFFFSPDGPNRLYAFLRNPESLREILRYTLLILFFYCNYYILVPRLYSKGKYFQFTAIIILCFFITMALPGLMPGMEHEMRSSPQHPGRFPRPPAPNRLFFNVRQHIFLFLASFFFSLMLRLREKLRQTEEEKLQSELSYLKAQVNPHFLFNTLNSIYALAIEKSDDTATAVVKLSGMMRYVLSDAVNDFVPLEKEISYLQDFVELQELRFGSDIPVRFTVNGVADGKRIAPLILITFVENAFKYGVNAEAEMLIDIEINIENNMLRMKVYNKKVKIQQQTENSNRLGIQNTKNRLALLYPGKHDLIINETEKDYTVLLTLTLL